MSTRTNIRPQAVIGTGSNPAVSGAMTGNIISNPTVLQSVTVGTYAYSWTGTSPVGTIKIQISNDYSVLATGLVNNAGTWTDVYFTLNGAAAMVNSIPISGNSGNGCVEWTSGAYAIRTVYTYTSGTGTLTVIVNGKVS